MYLNAEVLNTSLFMLLIDSCPPLAPAGVCFVYFTVFSLLSFSRAAPRGVCRRANSGAALFLSFSSDVVFLNGSSCTPYLLIRGTREGTDGEK